MEEESKRSTVLEVVLINLSLLRLEEVDVNDQLFCCSLFCSVTGCDPMSHEAETGMFEGACRQYEEPALGTARF